MSDGGCYKHVFSGTWLMDYKLYVQTKSLCIYRPSTSSIPRSIMLRHRQPKLGFGVYITMICVVSISFFSWCIGFWGKTTYQAIQSLILTLSGVFLSSQLPSHEWNLLSIFWEIKSFLIRIRSGWASGLTVQLSRQLVTCVKLNSTEIRKTFVLQNSSFASRLYNWCFGLISRDFITFIYGNSLHALCGKTIHVFSFGKWKLFPCKSNAFLPIGFYLCWPLYHRVVIQESMCLTSGNERTRSDTMKFLHFKKKNWPI